MQKSCATNDARKLFFCPPIRSLFNVFGRTLGVWNFGSCSSNQEWQRMEKEKGRQTYVDVHALKASASVGCSTLFFQVMFCNARQQVTCVNPFFCALTFARAAGGVLFRRWCVGFCSRSNFVWWTGSRQPTSTWTCVSCRRPCDQCVGSWKGCLKSRMAGDWKFEG